MLKFICPICETEADETELTPGGEAHLKRMGPGSSDQKFYNNHTGPTNGNDYSFSLSSYIYPINFRFGKKMSYH